MRDVRIISDTVGTPTDQREGRIYNGPPTDWVKPPNSTDKWIQCNTSKVEFNGEITDQFVHNLRTCEFTGSKTDGNGTSATSPEATFTCGGKLSSVAHGRQTITFQPSDDCSYRVTPPDLGTPKDLVWDTDLPSTFQTQDFSSNPFWLRHRRGDIETSVPGTGAGKFPKHYSVDCDDTYMDIKKSDGTVVQRIRMDGNSGTLSCKLDAMTTPPDPEDVADADGCNPNELLAKYYHVCGGVGGCKNSKWAVYAQSGKSCQNVRCKPGLVCCDSNKNIGKSCTPNKCYNPNSYTASCTNPKIGDNSHQNSKSGCPPAGLFNCKYTAQCELGNIVSDDSSDCENLRKGDSCKFLKTGTCTPDGGERIIDPNVGGYDPATHKKGTCSVKGINKTEDCTPLITYSICIGFETQCVGLICSEVCTRFGLRVSSTTCQMDFSGTCGFPTGGCKAKTRVGGGHLSLEKCTTRPATCHICDSATTCCVGDTCSTNSNCCNCNSATACCPGDSYPTNVNCFCLPGITCPENGVCSANGCAKGIMTGNSLAGWYCKGVNGGTDSAGCLRSSYNNNPPGGGKPPGGEVPISQTTLQRCVRKQEGAECEYNFHGKGPYHSTYDCFNDYGRPGGYDYYNSCSNRHQVIGGLTNCVRVMISDVEREKAQQKNQKYLTHGARVQEERVECTEASP